jgi:hypothetical protein
LAWAGQFAGIKYQTMHRFEQYLKILQLYHESPPLQDLTRYHCPIIGFLNIPKKFPKTSKRKIWLYDRGDYDKFKQYLSDVDWDSLISFHDHVI